MTAAAEKNGTTKKHKAMTTVMPKDVQALVALSNIREEVGFNVRTVAKGRAAEDKEEKELRELGESIKESGVLQPFLVEYLPDGKTEYVLRAASRRFRAMKLVGMRGEVPVTIRTYARPIDRILDNVTENVNRKDVHTADLAKRFYELQSGTWPGALEAGTHTDDNFPTTADVSMHADLIAAKFKLDPSYVKNLIRAWRSLCEECLAAWRNEGPSFAHVVLGWAKLKTPEEQLAALAAWRKEKARKTEAKSVGKDKAKKAKKGKVDEDVAKLRVRSELSSTLEKFRQKLESGPTLKGRDVDVAHARIETLEWVLGQRKRLTFT